MLYLEDFLELIEQLPSELRDRFTEMREADLQVQNASDKSEESVKMFFRNAAHLAPEERQRQAEKIRREYYGIIDNADEKVNLANTMLDLVDRFLRKLDTELGKFKLELEADNPGITEQLEKKVLDAEETSNRNKRERKKRAGGRDGDGPGLKQARGGDADGEQSSGDDGVADVAKGGGDHGLFAVPGSISDNIMELDGGAGPSHLERGPRVVDYRALASGDLGGAFLVPASADGPGTSGGGATSQSTSAFLHAFQAGGDQKSRPRKLTHRVGEMLKEVAQRHEAREAAAASAGGSGIHSNVTTGLGGNVFMGTALAQTASNSEDETSDPNEQRYCICNQVSYGEMVACDNKGCPFEWFHYVCVGITQPPRGKWYCPQCTAAMKRRASRLVPLQQETADGHP